MQSHNEYFALAVKALKEKPDWAARECAWCTETQRVGDRLERLRLEPLNLHGGIDGYSGPESNPFESRAVREHGPILKDSLKDPFAHSYRTRAN